MSHAPLHARPAQVQPDGMLSCETHKGISLKIAISSARLERIVQDLKEEHEFLLNACGMRISTEDIRECRSEDEQRPADRKWCEDENLPAVMTVGRVPTITSLAEDSEPVVAIISEADLESVASRELESLGTGGTRLGQTKIWGDAFFARVDLHDVWKQLDNKNLMCSPTARLCRGAEIQKQNGRPSLMNPARDQDVEDVLSNQPASHKFPLDRLVVNPFARRRILWDLMGALSLTWDMFRIPVGVFDPPEDSFSWQLCSSLSLSFWSLDIFASCFTGYVDREGGLVQEFKRVLRRYLRTWFVIDMTTVTMEWIEIFANAGVKTTSSARLLKAIRFLKIFRALRMLRFFKLAMRLPEIILTLQDHMESPFLDPIFAMMQNALSLLVLTHIVACAWFGIGLLPTKGPSWIKTQEFQQESFWFKYLETFRMALTCVCGRSPWIQPENIGEVIFLTMLNLLGLMIFACFVGGVTSRLTKIRDIAERESVQMFQLKRYLRENKTSLLLRERVIQYADYARQQHKKCFKSENVELLRLISGPLHVELETEVHQPYLVVCPFFYEYALVGATAMSQVCFSCVSHDTLARHDTLFHRNGPANKFFVVKTGVLGYLIRTDGSTDDMEAGNRVILARRGHWLCEQSLWLPWVHRSRMKALIETDVITVNAETFRKTSLCHVDVFEDCRRRAVEVLSDVRALREARWDVPVELVKAEDHVNDEFHKRIAKITEALPVSKRFQNMVHKAEQMASLALHDHHHSRAWQDSVSGTGQSRSVTSHWTST